MCVVGNQGQSDFIQGRTKNNKSTVARTYFLLWMPGKYSEWDIKERTKEEMSVPALSLQINEWTFICIWWGRLSQLSYGDKEGGQGGKNREGE